MRIRSAVLQVSVEGRIQPIRFPPLSSSGSSRRYLCPSTSYLCPSTSHRFNSFIHYPHPCLLILMHPHLYLSLALPPHKHELLCLYSSLVQRSFRASSTLLICLIFLLSFARFYHWSQSKAGYLVWRSSSKPFYPSSAPTLSLRTAPSCVTLRFNFYIWHMVHIRRLRGCSAQCLPHSYQT
jgi:hypothetical protein